MYCRPTKVMPAVVHPTKCCVNHTFENVVVPHVFPSHTTNVHHTNIQSQEHYPHTQSAVNEVTSTDIGPVPGPPPPPTVGPGMVGGAFAGPGMGGILEWVVGALPALEWVDILEWVLE